MHGRGNRLLDLIVALGALSLAYLIDEALKPWSPDRVVDFNFLGLAFITLSSAWLTSQWFAARSRHFRAADGGQFITGAATKSATVVLFVICVAFILGLEGLSRSMMALFFLFQIVFIMLAESVSAWWVRHENKEKLKSRNLLIFGSRERAKEIIRLVGSDPSYEYKVLGCLESDPVDVGREVDKGVKVIGSFDDMEKVMKSNVVDEVVFAMPLSAIPNAHGYIVLAEEIGTVVRIIPDWQIYSLAYHPRIASLIFEPFKGLPTMALLTTNTNRFALMIKDTLDYALALVALVLSSPFMLLVALGIKISSKGPVVFKQERCGLNGRRFTMYKFRTMRADAEQRQAELVDLNESDGPVFKMDKDPRIIPIIGDFLRKTGLDELPQLVNVINGDMSVVGPRPPIPGEVGRYDIPQLRRLSVKPGITCLWQCQPRRNQVSFDKWVKLDLQYIDNWSLWLDFKIMLKTVVVMIFGHGR